MLNSDMHVGDARSLSSRYGSLLLLPENRFY
jgi:hypothetical protein